MHGKKTLNLNRLPVNFIAVTALVKVHLVLKEFVDRRASALSTKSELNANYLNRDCRMN